MKNFIIGCIGAFIAFCANGVVFYNTGHDIGTRYGACNALARERGFNMGVLEDNICWASAKKTFGEEFRYKIDSVNKRASEEALKNFLSK